MQTDVIIMNFADVNMPQMFPVPSNEEHMVSAVATQSYQRGSIDPCRRSGAQKVSFRLVFPALFALPAFQCDD